MQLDIWWYFPPNVQLGLVGNWWHCVGNVVVIWWTFGGHVEIDYRGSTATIPFHAFLILFIILFHVPRSVHVCL